MPLKNQKEKIRASPWKICFDFFLLIGGGVGSAAGSGTGWRPNDAHSDSATFGGWVAEWRIGSAGPSGQARGGGVAEGRSALKAGTTGVSLGVQEAGRTGVRVAGKKARPGVTFFSAGRSALSGRLDSNQRPPEPHSVGATEKGLGPGSPSILWLRNAVLESVKVALCAYSRFARSLNWFVVTNQNRSG